MAKAVLQGRQTNALSGFAGPLVVMLADPRANDHTGQWQLIKPLPYLSALAGVTITVPFGFSTDFASVPRKSVVLWGLFGGRAMRAAVLHDYLCRQRVYRREKCDSIFLEAMEADGMPIIKAMPMYLAVAAYTAGGAWKTEIDEQGFEPIG